MIDDSSYTNGHALASQNGHVFKDATSLADGMAKYFTGAESAGSGCWSAPCPLCGGKLLIIPHHPTESVGVNCSQGCPRDAVLEAVAISPGLSLLYRPEDAKRIRTPLHFLKQTGDTPENRLDALISFFPAAQDDSLWNDPEYQAFLKLGADESAFYSELIRRMGAQFWRKDAIENYLASLSITNPLLSATPLTETKTPILVNLADVQASDVEWLWWPYLARGMVAMLDGDPGIGKSLFTTQLAASLSRGYPLPDQQGKPRLPTSPSTVLFLAVEDSLEYTIRDRLDRADADVSRIHALTGFIGKEDEERAFTLQHMDVLRQAMEKHRPALVVIDPLQAYLGAIDMHRANETRPLMTALGKAAEAYQASILCVRHPAKPGAGGGKAIHRGLGSIDFIGAARTALFVESHPTDSDKALLMQSKSNIGQKGRTQIFSKKEGVFEWCGVSRVDAEVIAGNGRGPDPTAMLEILFWLEKELASGIPQPSQDILTRMEEEGFKPGSVKRAKKALGIISHHNGQSWNWELPQLPMVPPPTPKT
jgi:hypothetical protein